MFAYAVEVFEPEVSPGGHVKVYHVRGSDGVTAAMAALRQARQDFPDSDGLCVSSVMRVWQDGREGGI